MSGRISMKIGELLKTARVGRHLTQSDLAARGKCPDRCHQWEEGNTAGLDGNGAAFEDTGVERRSHNEIDDDIEGTKQLWYARTKLSTPMVFARP